MKKIIVSLFSIMISVVICFSQNPTDRPASLLYFGQGISPFFESYHKMAYKNEFAQLGKDFTVKISFIIDTSGSPKNIHVKNEEQLPVEIKNYFINMINATKHLWKPEVKDCRIIESDTMKCMFRIFNTKLNPQMRVEESGRLFKEEFSSLESDTPKNFDDYNLIVEGQKNRFVVFLFYETDTTARYKMMRQLKFKTNGTLIQKTKVPLLSSIKALVITRAFILHSQQYYFFSNNLSNKAIFSSFSFSNDW